MAWRWRPISLDSGVISGARDPEDRFSLSWWDALVVSAAQIGGYAFLLTEDLQDGQNFDGVKIVDPFRHDVTVIG